MMRQAAGTRLWVAAVATVVTVAALPLAPARPPGQAAPAGPADDSAGKVETGLVIVNVDPDQPADVAVELVSQADGSKHTLNRNGIPPGQVHTLHLRAEPSVPDGVYAASLTANRPIRAWAHHRWLTPGEDGREISAAMVDDAAAARDLVLTGVVSRFNGQWSIIAIQNADPNASAEASLEIFANDWTEPAVVLGETLPPGGSKTIDLATDARVPRLPEFFSGWARIRANRPVAASMLRPIDSPDWPEDIYVWNAVAPDGGPAAVLHAPLVYSAYEGATTVILVLNPGTSLVDVTVSYAGAGGTCAGLSQVHGTAAVAPGRTVFFAQEDLNIPNTGRSHLPRDCAATATIAATGNVVAVVAMSRPQGENSGYRALGVAEAGLRLALPPWRDNSVDGGAVHVVNPGSVDAHVRIALRAGADGEPVDCGAPCEATIPAGGVHRWEAPVAGDVPDMMYVQATIESDVPVLAAASDAGDAIADSLQVGLATAPGARRMMPFVFKNVAWSSALAPTPARPTAPPGAEAGAFDAAGASGIQVVNLSATRAADLEVVYRDHAGGAPVTLRRGGIPAGGTHTFSGPAEPLLPSGVFAATVRASQPVDVLTGHAWDGGRKGAYTDAVEASADVILPVLARRHLGQTSAIAIQSADEAAPADVVVDLNGATPGQPPRHVRTRLVIAAGGATTLVLDRAPGIDLPDGWQGSGRITADRPVAAAVTTDNPGSNAAYAYAAVSAGRLDGVLHAPLVVNAYPAIPGEPDAGMLTSSIAVHNPGSGPVTATVTYRASNAPANQAACTGTFLHADGLEATIDAGAVVVFSQDDVDLPPTGRSRLPAGCAASATIEASGPVAAVVNVADVLGGRAAAYAASGAAQGARRVRLPRVHRETASRTTAIQVMNAGEVTATVMLSATVGVQGETPSPIACGPACTATLAPGASHQWWPPAMPAFPPGVLGSAVVEGDQPLLVVAHDVPADGRDDTSIYRGYSATGVTTGLVPLVMNQAALGAVAPLPTLPAPTPTPAASLAALPSRMPARVGDLITTPLQLGSSGNAISVLDLRLDYDVRWLAFDTDDRNGDRLPDGIVSRLPRSLGFGVTHDPRVIDAKIVIHVSPNHMIVPNGMWLDVRLRALGEPPPGAGGLTFSTVDPISVVDINRRKLPARVSGGWRPTNLSWVFLAFARTSQWGER